MIDADVATKQIQCDNKSRSIVLTLHVADI